MSTLLTRYASRPLRLWAAQQEAAAAAARGKGSKGGKGSGSSGWGPAAAGRLRVAAGGRELTIEPAPALA